MGCKIKTQHVSHQDMLLEQIDYDPNSDIKHFLDKRIKVAKYFHTFLVAFHNKIKSNQVIK